MQDIIRFEYYKYGAQKGIVTQMPKKEIQIFQKGKRRKRKNVDQQWKKSGEERKTTTLWDGRRPL
jgi:hypothetical protein